MAYIIFLNPLILSNMFPGGAERDAFIPAASAAHGARRRAPDHRHGARRELPDRAGGRPRDQCHRGLRLVLGLGLSPAGAMGVIVIEGLVVLVLVLVGLREAIMDAVPLALKRAIGVGIGLFILFIGFVDGGLIVPGTPGSCSSVFPIEPPALGLPARAAADDRAVRAEGARARCSSASS